MSVPLEDAQGQPFALLPQLRRLKTGEVGQWSVFLRDPAGQIALRMCALKKSAEQREKAQARLCREVAHKQRQLCADTLEAAGYSVVLTTLTALSARQVLELYRHRWQIELAFKRLKSLLTQEHLKKTDQQGAKAWLQGKLLAVALIETLIVVGERFSPWGYHLPVEPDSAMSLV